MEDDPFKSCLDSGRTDDMSQFHRRTLDAARHLHLQLALLAWLMSRKLKLPWDKYLEYQRKGYKLTVPGLPEGSDLANDAQDEDDELDDDSAADCSTDV
jgi:hypothetical protein